jgi:hypothetical protein
LGASLKLKCLTFDLLELREVDDSEQAELEDALNYWWEDEAEKAEYSL